jgi:hypothetical protein
MKNRIFLLILLVGQFAAYPATGPSFETYFTDGCLRFDYFHTGTAKEETFSVDETWKEPVWPGSRTNLIDTLNLGKYQLQVFDLKTNALIYSRGFCSIFGEWQTTGEALKGIRRSFSESVRCPWPKRPVKITLNSRDHDNMYRPVESFVIDPSHPNIRKEAGFTGIRTSAWMKNGDPGRKVDMVVLPDGYTKDEMEKFRKDADRLLNRLFEDEPFHSRKVDFNVWMVELPSGESGIDNPNAGVYRDNFFSCSFNSFESDRYMLTWDNKTVRRAASLAPYDEIIILANDKKYGGGGIYNLYATCSSDNPWSAYVFTHEFGHSFAGLGDEYYTSDVAYSEFYPLDVEPWEANLTVCKDKSKLKWRDMVEADVPVPTPWDKEIFDGHQAEYGKTRGDMQKSGVSQASIDSLTKVNDKWLAEHLKTRPYSGKVGSFEGAGYSSKGVYRPYIDCRMFSRSMTPFDPVCRREIERVIEFKTR